MIFLVEYYIVLEIIIKLLVILFLIVGIYSFVTTILTEKERRKGYKELQKGFTINLNTNEQKIDSEKLINEFAQSIGNHLDKVH